LSNLLDRVVRTVREYDAQGWHRTGTRVDDESAEWLVGRVAERGESGQFGQEVRLESFELERVVPDESYVELDGRRVDGLPLFDGTFTDEVGISGRLGLAGAECDIGLIEFQAAGGVADIQALRESGRYKAFVGVVKSGLGESSITAPGSQFAHPLTPLHSGRYRREYPVPQGLAIRNGEFFSSRGGAPVVQVSSVEYERMTAVAESGAEVRVVAQAGIESTTAQNLIIEMTGSDSSLAPLVVMTPRSGWFNGAIERGGGVACWLEIMSSFSNKQPERDLIFIATSGHELGHVGLKSFLISNSELREKAHAWLHLGASIGAALDWQPFLQTSDDEFERVTLDSFTEEPEFADLVPLTIVPTGTTKSGEAVQINRFGGRFVSVIGTHALFHEESDQWPVAVDAEALSVYASALTRIAGRLSCG
jgi:hypothetical protein